MPIEDDLRLVMEQEAALVFERFDEDVAFELGGLIRQAGKVLNRGGITTGIYTFDRTLFYGATSGGTEFNRRWIERKFGLVKLMLKSSYRVVLERGDKPRVEPGWARGAATPPRPDRRPDRSRRPSPGRACCAG